MKMKRLPPDKRNKLIFVLLGTFGVIGMVYYFLIGPQNEQNLKLKANTAAESGKLQQIKKALKQTSATASAADEIAQKLQQAEEDSASGDLFAWTYDTIRQFKISRHIEIATIGRPVQGEVDLLPGFPYKQIKFQITGSGYYHDIGKFVADFENKYPHMRVINLSLDSSGAPDSVPEKLSFRLDIAALVKPNA